MHDFIQVQTSLNDPQRAQALARALVDRRLAACVHVSGPMTSIYHWQGAVETTQEWLCVAKTHRRLFDAVATAIGQLHSYETPEIVATPLVGIAAPYRAWLEAELAASLNPGGRPT